MHKKMVHDAEKIHECEVCKMKFKWERVLDNHVRNIHNTSRKILCEFCDSVFLDKLSLSKHVKDEHKEKKHKLLKTCDFCGNMLQEENLPMHIREVHENASMVKCGHCDKTFVKKSTLKKHLLTIHIRTKHQCEQCESSFTTIHNLKRHEKFVHELKGTKNFRCETCGKCFLSNDSLQKHVKHLHLNINNS